MALSPKDFKNLLGGSEDPVSGSDTDLMLEEDEDLDAEEEEGEEDGERNLLWAGEAENAETVTPEDAEELIDWLTENEPDIATALLDIATGVADVNTRLVDQGRQALQKAEQVLIPEYPELTDEQRQSVGDKIAEVMKAKGRPKKSTPAWKQALVTAIAQVRVAETEPAEEPDVDIDTEASEIETMMED